MKQPTVLSPNADADVASSDSSGRMLCRIRRRVYAMCSCRSDDGDYVAIGRAWRQILFHNWCRNVFSVSVVASTPPHFAASDVERLDGVAADGAVGVDADFDRSADRPPGRSK